ncbi:MAG: efflux RND transporter periplasmic adaptor subunit [Dissulfurimicrobium sp.]|uniref:efflux RND transporter periplasmic adaptor subunit n=1 Tax=Dissulfurimicrobium sp. TaxID=2022436 RepID=UPI003D138768
MRNMNRVRFVMAAVLAVGLLLYGCGEQKKGAGPPQPRTPEVAVITVQPEQVELTTELPGRVSAFCVAEVRPQVSGIIQKRLFTEGSDVKAGQVLYQIDPAPFQAAYDNAKAALAKAEANLIPARLKEERYRELVKIKAVSQQDYDDAYAAFKQAEAELASAKAAVETARINLGYTRVRAPISGRIGRSAVTAGALVTADQPAALATIQQLDPVYVDLTQSSAEMLQLEREMAEGVLKRSASADLGQVGLLMGDGSRYPLPGVLKFSEVMVEQDTGSVTMRAVFPNPKHILLPGMFVRGIVKEGVDEHAILVPQRAVTRDQKGDAVVMVVGAGERVEPRIIKVSRTIGDKWLVNEGLKAGDRVVMEGLQQVRPGAPVKVVAFSVPQSAAPAGISKPAVIKK